MGGVTFRAGYERIWNRELNYGQKVYALRSLGVDIGPARYYAREAWNTLPLVYQQPIVQGEAKLPHKEEFTDYLRK